METFRNYIDNQFSAASDGAELAVHEPATGAVYARLANATPADVDDAVMAASRAFPDWSGRSGDERAEQLERIADAMEQRLETFAQAESRDTGKPLSLARSLDIPRAIANFRFFAAAARQFSSESHAMGRHAINYTLRQPLGVVGCISPWNLPLYLFSWKVAPALACGNTVVGKPSEVTPATATLLAGVCREAGLPPGVLNVIHGEGQRSGAAIASHPRIRAISFTGSTATGRMISTAASPRFAKLSLEMGGKNPTLVFADCDFEKTARQVVRAAFTNQGQVCLCGSRILVEHSIYERFRERILELTETLVPGDPLDPGTQQGAVVSQEHYAKIMSCLETARKEGGELLCGGPVTLEGRCAEGWFIRPVLIEGLGNECRTNQEEIFGPVATLQPFHDEAQALRLANSSEYGLAASVWSNDLGRCHRLAAQLETGIVWVNCWLQRDLRTPFGGMKSSGLGHEGGQEAMRFFTEPRTICIEHGL